MTPEFVIGLIKESILLAMSVAAPMLLLGLVVGVLLSIFQTVTGLSEQTLTFIPKMAAAASGILIFGPWMIDKLMSFTRWIFTVMVTLAP